MKKSWYVSHLRKLISHSVVLACSQHLQKCHFLLGSWGCVLVGVYQQSLVERDACGYITPSLPGPRFGISGLISWISPEKRTSHLSLFERSEINKVGLLNLSQTRTVTYWERRKWMSLENISMSIETDWNIHTYQHLANLVALTRCAINTWWIAIYVYVFTNTYIYI